MSEASRREALRGIGLSAAALAVGCGAETSEAPPAAPARARGGDVPAPTVDLMKEHGVLDRVLLVYDEAARRLRADEPVEPAVVRGAAGVVRDFVQAVHEAIEERHVFPLVRDAGRHRALVDTLLRQHEAGRELTRWILDHAADGDARLGEALTSFTRMYRPHAGREDTVLFVAFRELATPAQRTSVMEGIEALEQERMGEGGYERFIATIGELERRLSIHALGAFTPSAPTADEASAG
ncbi:MAG TPA: hemerythrin domain-containing protein [Sandaracinaceae bacterium LLY-WYZ-13_1]|nr:hemerythrin domain-containing protein [Sandaracinaceae bacterium LLY-WYZ-13_1]